jgi:hypothetical protein
MTSIKIGWARGQYARDRYDTEVDLADLPLIFTEYGADPGLAETVKLSDRLEIARLFGEVHARTVYLRHEAAEAGWSKGRKPTEGMLGAQRDLRRAQALLANLLAEYKAREPATA